MVFNSILHIERDIEQTTSINQSIDVMMVQIMCHSIINTTSKPFKSTVLLRDCVSLEWLAWLWRRRSLEKELPIVIERDIVPASLPKPRSKPRDISSFLSRYRCCCCDGVRDTNKMAHKRASKKHKKEEGPDTKSNSRGAKRAQRGSQATERELECRCSAAAPSTARPKPPPRQPSLASLPSLNLPQNPKPKPH